MKRIHALVITAAMVLPLGGCLVHSGPDHSRQSSASKSKGKGKSKSCKPSHYWDGHKCRHKGKGKGARKHDGR